MEEIESKNYNPQIRDDQFRFILMQLGIKQVDFSTFIGRQHSYTNKILRNEAKRLGVEHIFVPDYFIRKLVDEIGIVKFRISIEHWNFVNEKKDYIKYFEESTD